MRVHAQHGVRRRHQTGRVVQLVVSKVPLAEQAAGVGAARIAAVLAVHAVAVAEALVGAPGALDAEGLVVCHVCRKAPDLVKRQGHALEHLHEALQIVLPPQPSAVSRIEVDGHGGSLRGDLLNRILHALLVCRLRCHVATVGVGDVRGQVSQAIRLHDKGNRQAALICREHRDKGIHVARLVLLDAIRAVPGSHVVARAVGILAAADLPIRSLRVTVAVRQVIEHQNDELRRRLGRSVLEDALNCCGCLTPDLDLPVDPVR
mmetsp:Transcript_50468/g.150945  ORF Transcript_50468/g.150945 Transcript_50468/m.150945 type:complete len:262 (+) Transcript_50468:1428-2213(+)